MHCPGLNHINHWIWHQAARTGKAERMDAPVPQKSNIPVLCTYNLTQNVVHCFSGSCWKCWHKMESDWTMELPSFPSCLPLLCPQLQVFPVPLPFSDTNSLLRWELMIFVPNPASSPALYACTAQPQCPDTGSHNFLRELTKLLGPDLAQPKARQSVHGLVASLRHTLPSSPQRHLWLKSASPSAEIRRAPGHNGTDSEEKPLIPNAVEKGRRLCKGLDHKNLLRALCTGSWVSWSYQELRLLWQRQWSVWKWIHQSGVLEAKL